MSYKFLQPPSHLLFLRFHLLDLKEFCNNFWPLLIVRLCLFCLDDCPLGDDGLVKQLLLLVPVCAQRARYFLFIDGLIVRLLQFIFIAGDCTTARPTIYMRSYDNGCGVFKVRTRTQLVHIVEFRGREVYRLVF